MRRTKFLALALVVAIMLMGAGYAAWTERIEINGTVETGEVDVSIVEKGEAGDTWILPRAEIGRSNKDFTTNDPNDWILKGRDVADYENQWIVAECELHTDKSVEYKFENLYPGAVVEHVLRLRNYGTLPARISDIKVTPKNEDTNSNKFLYKNLKVVWQLERAKKGSGSFTAVANGTSIGLKTLKTDLEAIDLTTNTGNVTLYPTDSGKDSDFRLVLKFVVDDDKFDTKTTWNADGYIEDNVHKGEDQKVSLGLEFNFTQAPEAPKQ